MTLETPERPAELRIGESEIAPVDTRLPDTEPAIETPDGPEINPLTTTIAAFLATSGAAWVIGGSFASGYARAAGIGAALIGAALVALSYRTTRPAVVQLLVIPAALGLSAVLVIPEAGGDLGELPGFVEEAFREGGLSTPPVAFDPGWRVIVVVLCAALVAAAATLAMSYAMPRLAVAIPLLVVIGGMLVQPDRGEIVTALVALVLVLAGLAVSFGVQLGREGATSGRFEARRLARGGTVVVVLAAGLAGLSQVGFLFPTVGVDQAVPPQAPSEPPPQDPGLVFTVEGGADVADLVWRTGVLDVYGEAENAWLTPPLDPDRYVDVPESGEVPTADRPSGGTTVEATVTMADRGGRALPVPGSALTVSGAPAEYDPRTDVFQAAGRLADGTNYTVTAALPGDDALAEAPAPSSGMAEYLEAPDVPPLVNQVLLGAPPESDGLYARLEAVRREMYKNVVAEGVGTPTAVSPERAQEIIVQQGTKATPYEIAAADALLARWVGVPSRIGYGYFPSGKEAGDDGAIEVNTEDAAVWLETYYEGVGWVATPKTPEQVPPQAEEAPRNQDPQVQAGEDRALLVYVPTEVQSVRLAYEAVGYWLLITLPWVAAALLIWMWYPAVLKVLRRGRRRRWAANRGVRERIAVAYSDVRDVANDFGIGHPTQTPLEFLNAIDPDPEHRELAWLATRALWGDLARDLRVDDGEAAEDMARSVRKRMARAQSPVLRIFAGVSRVSLRDPYTNEIPNLWPRRRHPLRAVGRAVRAVVGAPWRSLRWLVRRPATANSVLIVVLLLILGGCSASSSGGDEGSAARADQASEPKVPEKIQEFALLRSPSAERVYDQVEHAIVTDGRVYEIYHGATQQGLLQIAWLKSNINDRDKAKREVLKAIDTGQFTFTRLGEERAYVKQVKDLNFVLWFAPGDRYYQLFVAHADLEMADLERVVKGLLSFQRGDRHEIVNVPVPPGPPDPHLGSEG